MKSMFEQMGGAYTIQGDYRLPNLTLPPEKESSIGVWGQRHLRYLKQRHRVLYYNLLTSGKLTSHLADVESEAENPFHRIVKELSEKENLTEKLKADAPLEWVKRMNNMRSRAVEIVNKELVFV